MTETAEQPRGYVGTYDDGEGRSFFPCTADHMRKAVEHAHYSGDEDDCRYFAWDESAGTAGGFAEVTFRCIKAGAFDENDYSYSTFGVYFKDRMDGEPMETFVVTIDGRA